MQRTALILACAACLGALEVELRAPLTTIAEFPAPAGARAVAVRLVVPPGAPADLGAGLAMRDRDGGWWQRAFSGPLPPGEHRFTVPLAADELAAEPPPAAWAPMRRAERLAVYLWSARPSRVRVMASVEPAGRPSAPVAARLLAVEPGPQRLAVGERYEASCLPDPFPDDPWDDEVSISLVIAGPDGVRTVAGFLREPMRSSDRGDREDMLPAGPLAWAVRFRPRVPGMHRLRLKARWRDGRAAACDLPAVEASGAPATHLAVVDPADPRFFSVDGAFWWPIGLNLHNPYDTRSVKVNGTRLTPARGTRTYDAILDRLAAAGGDAAEIWMSSWNVGLVWRDDWPGFHGLDGLHLANAERLDAILDRAWSRGMRLKLVINNHGQASPKTDSEWRHNPLNRANGGPLAEPAEVFTHPAALAQQERLRRYIVARWADHPAVWGWKLWSEVDLTAGRGQPLVDWHEQAAARWRELDPSGRAVTTHWAGNYRRANPAICALPGIGYISLDAYRRVGSDRDGPALADLLAGSIHDPAQGLGRFGKPVLVTEFGAGSGDSPEDARAVDHHTGGWLGLVSGHAAAPMLWWWEWVDQEERWSPYGALRRYLDGEDLRGPGARSVQFAADAAGRSLWCRAWVRPGRALGYVLEPQWGARGGEAPSLSGARVRVGDQVAAGQLELACWDADLGVETARIAIAHGGGGLELELPAFRGHLAWKLVRR